jgi:hypothetical protein
MQTDGVEANERIDYMFATIIEIRAHRNGWKVSVFPEKNQAINYAQNRASFRSNEIRILDSTGEGECTIPFTEADRRGILRGVRDAGFEPATSCV